MNASINEREVFSDYFRYRAIFFDNESSKSLSLVASAGQVLGVAIMVGSIGLSIRRRDPRYLVGLLLPGLAVPVIRGKVPMPSVGAFDSLTGIALPMLEGYDAIRTFTQDTGKISALAKIMPLAPFISELNATTPKLKEVLVANNAAREAEEQLNKQQAIEDTFSVAKAGWMKVLGDAFETEKI